MTYFQKKNFHLSQRPFFKFLNTKAQEETAENASSHHRYDFFLSVKRFITVTFYGKPSFNASSPLFFKRNPSLNASSTLLFKVTLPTSAFSAYVDPFGGQINESNVSEGTAQHPWSVFDAQVGSFFY
jgi:hypothetical protein